MEMCDLSFSIDKHFVCNTLCDVIYMDICHIILSRPWQFDMNAIYNCRLNEYAFEWKGKKIKRLPSTSILSTKNSTLLEKSILQICSEAKFLSDYKRTSSIVALVVTKANPEQKTIGFPTTI